MANIEPTGIELVRDSGELNEAQAAALSLLCRENPELKFVDEGLVDGRTFRALVNRGFLEWRVGPADMGFAFTEKTRKLFE